MALFIICLILSVAGLGSLVYLSYNFGKKNIDKKDVKIDLKNLLIYLALIVFVGVSTIMSSYGLKEMLNFEFTLLENFDVIFGSFLLGSCAAVSVVCFVLHYYCKNLNKKEFRLTKILFIIGIPLVVLGLWILSEGFANQDIYPLLNGISFTKGFFTPNTDPQEFEIKFYGVIIVCGALFCYFYTDHATYKKFGEHGLIDSLFIVAFLLGIVGARLWSCFVLEPGYFVYHPLEVVTKLQKGGLAIQGGALLGIISGVGFVLLFRKYIDVRFLMDVAIPTILIAQVLGRWGNFLNQEVYGFVAPEWLMNLLPTIIRKNMYINGDYRVPLFLIEGIINLGGYFFIRYFLGKVCKFKIGLGYQAASYCIWYGLVRVILERFRDDEFEYGQSIVTAYVMLGIGILWLVAMILIHRSRMNKGLEDANGEKIKEIKNA